MHNLKIIQFSYFNVNWKPMLFQKSCLIRWVLTNRSCNSSINNLKIVLKIFG